MYNDSSIERDKLLKEFVDVTDLFPIPDGEQIIDVAAGGFYLVVVTDGGDAYGVGYDRARGYWTQFEHCRTRKPAYKIEIEGCSKALRCWANKNNTCAFILGENE